MLTPILLYNAEINFAQGNLHLALGETGAAKDYYLSALRLDPEHVGVYNNLGVLALQESRWELAARFFDMPWNMRLTMPNSIFSSPRPS